MELATDLLPPLPLFFFFFYLFLFLLPLPLLSYFLSIHKNHQKTRQPVLPPSPNKLPILGNLLQLGTLPHRSLFKLSQKHGPLMYLKLGSRPTVVVSSAETAKEFLKTHDLDCCTRPNRTAATKLTYNLADLAFAPYGALWRERRKVCITNFLNTKKVAFFQSTRDEEVERMIQSIYSSHSSVVNLSSLVLQLANNITCRTALGKRYDYNIGERDLPEMLKESDVLFGDLFFGDYIPGLRWVDVITGMSGRLEKNFRELDEFYEQVIEEHMEAETGVEVGEQREDIVDAFLRIQKDDPRLTKEHIKAVLMNIFIGGTNTSAAVLEWAMTELMREPQVMKEAQDEVRNLIKSKGKVTGTDLPHLHYMKCIIKEVLRLHTPAPLLREAMNEFRVHGFDIPAKTQVIVNAWAIGRDESSWENPEEFNPSRFINIDIDTEGHDFQLIPFGAGRRICPGMNTGMAVVELALATLLYSFNWELPEGMSKEDIDMDEKVGINVIRKTPLHLVATKYNTT